MMLLDDELFNAEELRFALASAPELLAVSGARSELPEAKVTLGLETRAEPDGVPCCGWCGRSNPPGGLADESLGGPEVHACRSAEDCAQSRAKREPRWIDQQHPGWREDWKRYLAAQQPAGAALTYGNPDEDGTSPEFLAALSMVRELVESGARDWLAPAGPAAGALELSAQPVTHQAAPPPVVSFGHWDHTLRNPAHRTHTMGHRITHRGPCTADCMTAPAEPAPEPAAAARTAARRRSARRFRARA